MNAKLERDATAKDANDLAQKQSGHMQRELKWIAAGMTKQERRIRELEAALKDAVLDIEEWCRMYPMNTDAGDERIIATFHALLNGGTK